MDEERRRNPRVQDKRPVTIQSSEETMKGEIENLTFGGAFISCEKPLAPGDIFDMILHVQDRPEPLRTKAQVVRSEPTGMGVRFLSEPD